MRLTGTYAAASSLLQVFNSLHQYLNSASLSMQFVIGTLEFINAVSQVLVAMNINIVRSQWRFMIEWYHMTVAIRCRLCRRRQTTWQAEARGCCHRHCRRMRSDACRRRGLPADPRPMVCARAACGSTSFRSGGGSSATGARYVVVGDHRP